MLLFTLNKLSFGLIAVSGYAYVLNTWYEVHDYVDRNEVYLYGVRFLSSNFIERNAYACAHTFKRYFSYCHFLYWYPVFKRTSYIGLTCTLYKI